ncbi:MAG: hypothetical protein LBL66_00755 [Clostridiales bacterium]|jgi:hypothetical protein|nr:hypothetical protein [Clostridiales bacterium]
MKRGFVFIIVLCLSAGVLCRPVRATLPAYAAPYTYGDIVSGIVDWKRGEQGFSDGRLLQGNFLRLAGSTPGDWFPFGMSRLGINDDYAAYRAALSANIGERYADADKLDKYKATEWHRASLALLAAGGDPYEFGYFGNTYNLIADGTYNRGLTVSPGAQGINGWIWGLIAMDLLRYRVPDGAFQNRGDFIAEILAQQLPDGGFALDNTVSDPDITSMAIQSLSPYYNSEAAYTYKSQKIKDADGRFVTVSKKARTVIDEAIDWLSSVQAEDGDYASWGAPNVESTVWAMIAAVSVGIDLETDPRFIKNGRTVIDGILRYKTAAGGFTHSFVPDPDNPAAVAGQPNSMASEQTLYGLAALIRFKQGKRGLFDLRPDGTLNRVKIDAAINAINELPAVPNAAKIAGAIDIYKQTDALDRCYVANYRKLAVQANALGVALPDTSEAMTGNGGGGGVLLHFSQTNRERADSISALPFLTTEYWTEISSLYYIIGNSEDFDGKLAYQIKIEKAYNELALTVAEIKALSDAIGDNLYPFSKVGLKDRKTVYALVERFNALSAYDRENAFDATTVEALNKAKTKVDNLTLALWLSIGGGVFIAGGAAFVVFNIRAGRKRKALKFMPATDE